MWRVGHSQRNDEELDLNAKVLQFRPVDEILKRATTDRLKAVALICAAGHACYPELVEAFLRLGTDPNAVANMHTAVQACAMWKKDAGPDILQTLLRHGAHPDFMAPEPDPYSRALVSCVRIIHGLVNDGRITDIRKRMARLLIWYGAAPVTRHEMALSPIPMWYLELKRSMAHCLLTKRAVERALAKQGLLHRDVIPLISDMVWATRLNLSFWNFPLK